MIDAGHQEDSVPRRPTVRGSDIRVSSESDHGHRILGVRTLAEQRDSAIAVVASRPLSVVRA